MTTTTLYRLMCYRDHYDRREVHAPVVSRTLFLGMIVNASWE